MAQTGKAKKKAVVEFEGPMETAGTVADKLHNDVEIPYEAGDYILTGVKGERYPCKGDVFRETYEIVTE